MKALVIIDMQMYVQNRIDAGRDHVNPQAPDRIGELAVAFRAHGLPVLHVRHADADPDSHMHPGGEGYDTMPCARSLESEPVFMKRTSSAFASTDLAAHLRDNGIDDVFVTGAVAAFCISSTVRAGCDLGFNMLVVRDAVVGFDMPSAHLSARTVFDVTMAQLESDFARVVDASSVLPD